MTFIGIDIGGSKIKAVLVESKKILQSVDDNTPADLASLLDVVIKIFEKLSNETDNKVNGVGCAIAGVLDKERIKVLKSPNIKYLDNQPIKQMLREKLQLPVKIEHDVHCFLLAEKEVGLAKRYKNILYLTAGTGIGGALMVDNKIIFGAHGAAGECGHIVIDIEKGLDLEELASNKFIVKNLGIGSNEALDLVKTGDQRVIKVFEELGKNLGIGIANLINIFDPEAVILAGGISKAKEFILPGINESINRFVISLEARKTEILFSEMSSFGGALGATFLFSDN